MSDTTVKALEAATGGTDLGAISVMQSTTPVKITKTTVVDQTGAEVPFAKDATVTAVTTSLGTDGTSPPAISGTGVRGWLRGIYERLTAGISITGTVEVANDSGNPLPVSGPVTDAQLRASALPVSGTVTTNQGTAGAQAWPVTGPVTDAQLRASAVAVSGPVTDAQLRASAVPVSGPLTDAQLRASVVPVTGPASTLIAFVQSAANAANALTLPAVTGQYHYITQLVIRRSNTTVTAVAAAASNLSYTTTNLGGLVIHTSNIAAAGTTYEDARFMMAGNPLRSTASGTATVIQAFAAGAGVQTEIIVFYYTAP